MKKKIKKEDYWKPFDESMYDCCWCGSNCATPCARHCSHNKSKYPFTISLFGDDCSRFVKNKPVYKLMKMYPRADPTIPRQKDNGYIIETEIELTKEELEYIMEYSDEYNYKTPKLENKIRKVLE